MIVYFHESFQSKDRILPVLGSYTFSHYRNTHIPNIHALNSDTHTLFLSILIQYTPVVHLAENHLVQKRPLSAKLFRAKFNHPKVQLAQNSVL